MKKPNRWVESPLDRLLWTMGYRPVISVLQPGRPRPTAAGQQVEQGARQPWTPVPTIQVGEQAPLPVRHESPSWRSPALVGV
jgi:hypothetical protein